MKIKCRGLIDTLIFLVYLLPYLAFTSYALFLGIRREFPIILLSALCITIFIASIAAWYQYDLISFKYNDNSIWKILYPKTLYVGFTIPLIHYFMVIRSNDYLEVIKKALGKFSYKRIYYIQILFYFLVIIGLASSIYWGTFIIFIWLAIYGLLFFFSSLLIVIDIVINNDRESLERYLTINQLPFGILHYFKDKLKNEERRRENRVRD
jgi:hypothetical protein